MVIGTVPWRARRPARSDPAVSRRERKLNAAATRDPFMDVIVLISVVVFLLLVIGVGMLVLQAAFTHLPV